MKQNEIIKFLLAFNFAYTDKQGFYIHIKLKKVWKSPEAKISKQVFTNAATKLEIKIPEKTEISNNFYMLSSKILN